MRASPSAQPGAAASPWRAAAAAVLALWLALAVGPAAAQQRLFGLIGEPVPLDPSVPATLPALSAARLVTVDTGSRHRVQVDAASLAVDQDRLVRYTLLVTTSGGARNLTYEALRCDTRERRVMAVGRADDAWSLTPDSAWRPVVRGSSVDQHHAEIAARLCEGPSAASSRPERLAERLTADLSRRY